MMSPTEMQQKLVQVFSDRQASVLADVIQAAYSDLVRTGDFNELKEIVRDLATAQQRTEQHVEELTVAQQRTEQRVEELTVAQRDLATALRDLATAQRDLASDLRDLATAQRDLASDLRDLATAQQDLTTAQQDLATAQRKTERSLQKLSEQVGGLSDRMGGDLEDVAFSVLPDVLVREFGWQVGLLSHSWQLWNGKEEIDGDADASQSGA
jgi:DNA repair ATPase RecN